MRLVTGSRLDVVGEEGTGLLTRPPDDDPRKPMVMAHLWPGELQEAIMP
ncbi:hypothetical protein GCM10010307_63710 [Streptomyces vastus]|uniref:Alpha/beta hydrolase n=1 Tax=Streptomyces vastus TaxID=285451 RepID=A0ABN3RHE9_9ACTN